VDNFGEPELLVCTGKGSESRVSKPQCQAVDGTIERQMQRFDPKRSTITLSQQIGLPLNLSK
jgi:hypothetical protein